MSRANSIDILSKLLSFDSTSHKSNLELIEYLANYLDCQGIKSELIFDSTRKKANLFATLAGPEDVPGIVLSGHTDVVPVTGQNWSKPAFKLSRDNNRLYGRGSTDMKGFIAVCMGLTEHIQTVKLKQPFHFAFTYDEEVGCFGARTLVSELKNRAIIPSACIIGEPTSMQAIRAHKGKISQRCHVKGHACHSSRTDEGVNAVEYSAKIINFLHELSLRIERDGPFDEEYTPSYTSVHTGPIHGGTVLNIIPDYCTFDFEFRNIPNHEVSRLLSEVKTFAQKSLLPRMQKKNLNANIEFETISEIPSFNIETDHTLTKLCLSLSPVETVGKNSFGTEAGLFQDLGIQTIVCGPGNIEQAHKPDEYIEIDQLRACELFLKQIIFHATEERI